MSRDIDAYILSKREKIETKIGQIFKDKNIPPALQNSMTYSLLAGGKRLRPTLLYASYDTFAPQDDKVLTTAVALEMIHTYSLIHDDLPAMDDDDYRRGALTNHRQFDEATAILAGDALLTYSFELIVNDMYLSNEEKVMIVQALSTASGAEGMVAGQILDIEGEDKALTLEELEKIHERKTGELITFAITSGAYLANIDSNRIEHLKKYAYYLGLIFQVQDDILDVVGDPNKLGKPVGSDVNNDKSTYPNLLGLEGAKLQKEKYENLAIEYLKKANASDSYLLDLLYFFSQRDH